MQLYRVGEQIFGNARRMRVAIIAACMASVFCVASRISSEASALAEAHTCLAKQGFERSIGIISSQAANRDADAASQMLLGLALMEGGYVDACSRALHRAAALDPELVADGEKLVALFGTRHPAIRERLVREVSRGSLEALLILGIFRLWSDEGEQGRALVHLYDMASGGDSLAATVCGTETPRAETRAQRYARSGRYSAALAESANALAQQPSALRKGRLAALLLSAGHLNAAENILSELLHHASPLDRFELVLPEAGSEWWNRNGDSPLSLAAREKTIGGIVALAVLGRTTEAEAALAEYRATTGLSPDRALEVSVYIIRSADALPPSGTESHADPAKSKPAEIATEETVIRMIGADDFSGAAEKLIALQKGGEASPSLHFLAGAILLGVRDIERASSELQACIVSESGELPQLRLTEMYSAKTLDGIKAWLDVVCEDDGKETARLFIHLVLSLERGEEGASEELLLLELRMGKTPVIERLRAKLGDHSARGVLPPQPESSALELVSLGDEAFRTGKYELAMKRYQEAGVKDASVAGLSRALLRGAYATGDFRTAGTYLLRVVDDEKARIEATDGVASFSTGIGAAYGSNKDMLARLGELTLFSEKLALNDGVWLLRGILAIERGAWYDADNTFRRYFQFSATPHPLAQRFQKYAAEKFKES